MVDAGRAAAGQAGGILVKGKAGCKDPGPLGVEDQPGSEYMEKGHPCWPDCCQASPAILRHHSPLSPVPLCGGSLPAQVLHPTGSSLALRAVQTRQGQAHGTPELEFMPGEAGREPPAHDATNRGG